MARRGHGEGSIYKRKDGRYAAAITLENRKRKYFYGKTPETSPGLIQGVLDLLLLSLSCDRASWQIYQTFKPTDSGVEDIRAEARDLFLFRPLLLLPATCARLRTLLVISTVTSAKGRHNRYFTRAKQEKRGVCIWFNTVVFLPTALRCGTHTLFSFQCTASLF